MLCVHCQTPVPDDAHYCYNCGSLVSDAEGQAAATAAMDESATQQMESLLREAVGSEFKIEKMLGRGGMAAVYLATEVQLSRKVAIKVLPPELTFGHGVERFTREAKTAAKLDHPNIIPIHRVSTTGKVFWYAMKYVEGKALDEVIKERERFSLEETIELLHQVARALDYGHKRDVIHRDIKPANIMLDEDGHAIVTDFGIAKALTEGTLTASGAIIGTPYYMSPEQAMGIDLTGASDQYSLGVVAYQMLSGQLPFEGKSAVDILQKHCTVDPPPLDVLRPGLPKHVYAAVDRALAKAADDRFPTVGEFIDALVAPWEGMAALKTKRMRPSEAPTLVAGTLRRAQRRRRTVKAALISAAAVVVIAAGLWAADLLPLPFTGSRSATEESMLSRSPSATDTDPTTAGVTDSSLSEAIVALGHITVTGLPPNATVLVDGTARTDSSFAVAAGLHVVRWSAPGFVTVEDTVLVSEGDTLALAFRRVLPERAVAETQTETPQARRTPPQPAATGLVRIRVRPTWATIYINAVRKADNNRYQEELPPGTHAFRFERDGYVTLDTSVTVQRGDTVALDITLVESGGR